MDREPFPRFWPDAQICSHPHELQSGRWLSLPSDLSLGGRCWANGPTSGAGLHGPSHSQLQLLSFPKWLWVPSVTPLGVEGCWHLGQPCAPGGTPRCLENSCCLNTHLPPVAPLEDVSLTPSSPALSPQGILTQCEGEEVFLGRFVYSKGRATVQTFELQVGCAPGRTGVAPSPRGLCWAACCAVATATREARPV